MLAVKDIMTRIRSSTHDKPALGYKDHELLGFINDGIRFIRRMVNELNPTLICQKEVGEMETGQHDIRLEEMATKIFEVRLDGRRIPRIHTSVIENTLETGVPFAWYGGSGFSQICVYPIPDRTVTYEVTFIPDMKLLTLNDSSPLPTDFDDFLFEYAVIRASLGNEFDMSQETQLMSQIITQIENCLKGMYPSTGFIESYWEIGSCRRRY